MFHLKAVHLQVSSFVLWAIALTLMIVHTASRSDTYLLGQWSILCALGGCVFAGWAIVTAVCRKERVRAEYMARLISERLADREVDRIH